MIDWLKPLPPMAQIVDGDLRDRHVTLQRDLRRLRIITSLLVLCIIAVGVLHMRAIVQDVRGDDVAAAFEKQASRVYPKLVQAAGEVGEKVAPIVGEAFAAQVDVTAQRLSRLLDGQMERLGEELPVALEAQVQRKLQNANARVAQKLFAAFPALGGDAGKVDRLLASFQNGSSRWAGKTLTTTFARHIKELEAIKATLNGFVAAQNDRVEAARDAAAAEGKHKAHGKITPDQLLALWLEILDETLKGEGGESDLFAAPAEASPAAANPAAPAAKTR